MKDIQLISKIRFEESEPFVFWVMTSLENFLDLLIRRVYLKCYGVTAKVEMIRKYHHMFV